MANDANQLKITDEKLYELLSMLTKHGIVVDAINIPEICDIELGFEDEFDSGIFNAIGEADEECFLTFDPECIEDDDAYLGILESLFSITKGDIKPINIRSQYDEENELETLSFIVNERNYSWEFSHDTDWLDDKIIDSFPQLVEEHSQKRCVKLLGSDFVEILCLPKEISELMVEHLDTVSYC